MVAFKGSIAAVVGSLFMSSAAAAQSGDRPIVIELQDIESTETNDVFTCTIPVDFTFHGSPRPAEIRVIARAYEGRTELSSTGLTTTPSVVASGYESEARVYESVPAEFGLSAESCGRIDGLRIEGAWCSYEDGARRNCLDRVRFSDAAADDPTFTALR